MKIVLSEQSKEPMYLQISSQIKKHIVNGELPPGESLPSIRFLAKELSVSVITTKKALEILEQDSLIYSKPGKGYFVNNNTPEELHEQNRSEIIEKIKKVIVTAKESGLNRQEVKEIIKGIIGDLKW